MSTHSECAHTSRTKESLDCAIVGGATGGVRGLSDVVRGAQSGFVRFYALLVIAGMAGLGLYFLLVAS